MELTENLLVVGSDQGRASSPGAIFVYRRNGTSWSSEQVLSDISDFSANRSFGSDVAVSSDEQHIFVGAPSDANGEHGAVFVYNNVQGAGWQLSSKLVAPDGETLDLFGGTVEVSGDNLAVAAYRTDDRGFDSGSVYMFRHQPTGGWTQVDKLTIPDARGSDLFGNILTIQGDLLVVSSVLADLNGNSSQGAVYTFARDPADGHWHYESRLAAPEGSPSDFYGSALAISGDILAVGAYGRSVPGRDEFQPSQGSVYLYRRDANHPSGWKLLQLLKGNDGEAGDWFGRSVAFDGDILMVGAAPFRGVGAAYAFRRGANGIADNWRQVHKFLYSGDTSRPYFGDDVVISPHVVVIAARDDGDIAWKDGAAFIYNRNFDVTAPAHHYDQWRTTHFSSTALLDPSLRDSLWGDHADPDGDNIPNASEYFAGSLPLVPDPISSKPVAAFGDGNLIWTFPTPDDPGVSMIPYVQASTSDLSAWERFYQANMIQGNENQELTISNYLGNEPSRFFRVTLEEE